MKTILLSDIDLLEVGNTIQLYGAIYAGNGVVYFIPLPDEDPEDVSRLELVVDWTRSESPKVAPPRPTPNPVLLRLDDAEMAQFLRQTDVQDIRAPHKAILRKSQRVVDQVVSWRVFRRDGFTCRYCGRTDVPLTVDHVDLWESGGATVEENLVSACRRCNKLRGSVEYSAWLASVDYARVSVNLRPEVGRKNVDVLSELPKLEALRGSSRSRK